MKDIPVEDRRAVEGALPGETATARAAHQSLLKGGAAGFTRAVAVSGTGVHRGGCVRGPGQLRDQHFGLFTPQFAGTESVLLAAGILGATVMPHVIYLHSALTQHRVVGRTDEGRKKIFRFELVDVVIAMAIAGTINASMLIMAAALFNANGLTDVGDIDQAFEQLGVLVSDNAAIIFGIALLASGFSSSSVGTIAGQVVMQGFINRRIPLFLRRLITMTPALVTGDYPQLETIRRSSALVW